MMSAWFGPEMTRRRHRGEIDARDGNRSISSQAALNDTSNTGSRPSSSSLYVTISTLGLEQILCRSGARGRRDDADRADCHRNEMRESHGR
jgi:hypothetical protein